MTAANYPGDPSDPSDDTPFDALKDNSLNKAGIAYLLGDASLFAAGAMKGQWKEAATGALWGIAGLFPAFYGNPKAEKQLELLSHNLGDYLRKQGVEIPKNPTTELLLKPQGVWDQMEAFFYTYPSQMLNAVYAIGSTTLLKSGWDKNNHGDMAAGGLVMAGALAGLLVPEKKIDPENPPTTALGKVWSWFQEKPLRISSAFYYANNIGLIRGAWEDKRENPANKGYLFKYLTASTYIFGNLMLALSSKGHGAPKDKEDHTAMQKLAQSAAAVIAAQSPETQEALVQRISGYLSTRPHAHMKADAIAELLHQKLKEVSGKSISQTTSSDWQKRIHESAVIPPTPSL